MAGGVTVDPYAFAPTTTTAADDALPFMTSSVSWMTNETFGNVSAGAANKTVRWVNLSTSFYDNLLRPMLSISIGILGLPSLIVLMAVMLTPKYRRFSYTLYLTVMCVYDFIFILIEVIESVLQFTMNDKFIRSFLIWDFPCKMFEHIYYSSMNISMWLNVAVAVDRFIVIAFPFQKDAWCNRRNSWIVSLGLMLLVHSLGIVYYLNGRVAFTTILNIGYYCTRNPILNSLDVYMSYMGGIVSAMIFIGIFTTMSVYKLHTIKKKRLEMTSSQPMSGKDKTSRATVALVAIGVSAFVTQTPFIVNEMVRLYARLYDKMLYRRLWLGDIPGYGTAVKTFEALSFFINVQNFFFLFVLNGQFRRDVISLLTCGVVSKKEQPTSTTNPPVTVVTQ